MSKILFLIILVAFATTLSYARKLSQAQCGPLIPDSLEPPQNAELYLSVRGPGSITYKCTEANKPVVLSETAELASDPKVSEKWTAKLSTNADGALVLTTTSLGESKAENVLVLGDQPVIKDQLGKGSLGRWVVVSNTGADPSQGGIPGNNFVTRIDVVGGAPPRNCKAGETANIDVEATYNIYTCDPPYLSESPISGPAAAPIPASAQTPARVPANSPIIAVLTPPPPVMSPPVEEPQMENPSPSPAPEPAPGSDQALPPEPQMENPSPSPAPEPAPGSDQALPPEVPPPEIAILPAPVVVPPVEAPIELAQAPGPASSASTNGAIMTGLILMAALVA